MLFILLDISQVYLDDLSFVSGHLKNIKKREKAKFYSRMKFAYGITKEPEVLLVDIYRTNVKSENSKTKLKESQSNMLG